MSVKILAIDPGTTESAYVLLVDGVVVEHGKVDNGWLVDACGHSPAWDGAQLVVEMIASYGMAVGAEVFATCVWIGRFVQAWRTRSHFTLPELVVRQKVKLHLCGQTRAKDANIRAALIDRFSNGGGKEKAVGTKRAPGPLYGVKADAWQALALAVTFADGAAL